MKINKVLLGFMSFFISILGSSSISINEGTLDNVIYDFYSDDENILVNIKYHDYIEGNIPSYYRNELTFYLNNNLFYENSFDTLNVSLELKYNF